MRWAGFLAVGLLLTDCSSQSTVATRPTPHLASPSSAPSPSPRPSPSPLPSPSPPPPTSLYLTIVQSDYGFLSAQTDAGAVCSASATLPNGHQAGGLRNPQTAGGDGTLSWLYPQPSTDQGQGVHRVACTKGSFSSSTWAYFEVGS